MKWRKSHGPGFPRRTMHGFAHARVRRRAHPGWPAAAAAVMMHLALLAGCVTDRPGGEAKTPVPALAVEYPAEAATDMPPKLAVSQAPSPAAVPGKPLILDLGEGVELTFVWIGDLSGWAGEFEVTNAQFRRFRPEHNSGEFVKHTLNGDRQPVLQVNAEDAAAFAGWVHETCRARIPAGYAVRLPSGPEWLTLARCGDARVYPWGAALPPTHGNYADEAAARAFPGWIVIQGYDDGYAVTAPVQHSGVNDWGLCGVGGNVREWTTELKGGKQILRGGSWDDFGDGMRCDYAFDDNPATRNNLQGFRLVVLRQD